MVFKLISNCITLLKVAFILDGFVSEPVADAKILIFIVTVNGKPALLKIKGTFAFIFQIVCRAVFHFVNGQQEPSYIVRTEKTRTAKHCPRYTAIITPKNCEKSVNNLFLYNKGNRAGS